MGCDIHIVVERKWEGRWVGLRTDQGFGRGGYNGEETDWVYPDIGQRNYAFFARLAGVRGDKYVETFGIPGDASDLTLMMTDRWGSDGHSFSYLPLKEFAERWCAKDEAFITTMAAERLDGKDRAYARLLDRASIGMFDPYDDMDVEDFRVVFWFDN
jgi:hypothetical protein